MQVVLLSCWSVLALALSSLAASTSAGSGSRSQRSSSLTANSRVTAVTAVSASDTSRLATLIAVVPSGTARASSRVSALTNGSGPGSKSLSRATSSSTYTNATLCQQQWVAWTTSSISIWAPYETTTYVTWTSYYNYMVTQGVADIYGTIGGYTRASGTLTPTASRNFSTGVPISYWTTTKNNTIGIPYLRQPSCSIGTEDCSSMLSEYRSSLSGLSGLSSSLGITQIPTTIPKITPAATNSPRCDTNTVRFAGCGGSRKDNGCTVSGSSVQVYYWPPETSVHNVSRALRNSTGPRTIVTRGITMTSPTVYLSFDSLSAYTHDIAYRICGSGSDAITNGVAWYSTPIGSTHTSSWLSLMPSDLSTLERMRWSTATFPEAAITAMGQQNASDYRYWANLIAGASGVVTASRLDFAKIDRPDPRAYYLRPIVFDPAIGRDQLDRMENYAKGCYPYGPNEACHTIFDGEYRAQLSLPAELRHIDPAWSACGPFLSGVRDPPIVLTATDKLLPDTATTTATTSPTRDPAIPASQPDAPTVRSTAAQKMTTTSPPPSAGTEVVDPGDPGQADPVVAQPPVQTVTFADPPQSAVNAGQALTQIANPLPTAVITVGGTTITVTSSGGNAIVGTATVGAGGVTEIRGATVSNAGSAIVVQPAPQQQTQAPIATVGTQPIMVDPAASAVVIGGATVTQGQQTVIAGTSFSLASDSAVVGSSTIALPASQATTATTLGDLGVVIGGGSAVVGATSLAAGQVATVDGTVVSVNPTAVVVGSSTIALPAAAQTASTIATVANQPVIAVSGSIVVGSSTLTAGQVATIDGTVVSVNPTAVVLGSSTIALPAAAQTASTVATIAGQPVVAASGSIVIGSTTLTAGQVVTISGTAVSVNPNAVVIGSSTIALTANQPGSTIATVAGQQVVAGSGSIVIGSTTLTGGQVATISGTIISVNPTAVIIGSSTISLPSIGNLQTITSLSVRQASITVAGQTITANADGAFVIGSVTLRPGGSAMTISGTTISLAPADAYVVINGRTSSLARPQTQTIVKTIARTESVKAGATPSAPTPAATPSTSPSTGDGSTLRSSLHVLLYAAIVAFVL